MDWRRYDPGRRCLILTLHIQPGARASAFVGQHGDAFKLKIAAPATENKANAALIEFLSEALGVQKSRVAIRHGATARRKVVEIAAGPELAARLDDLVRQ